MKKQIWQLFKCIYLFPSFSTFTQQYKKSNRGHDILSYTFSFILAKTQKSIWNNFYDAFIQISGKYKKYLTQRDTPSCSKKYTRLSGFGFNKTRLL